MIKSLVEVEEENNQFFKEWAIPMRWQFDMDGPKFYAHLDHDWRISTIPG